MNLTFVHTLAFPDFFLFFLACRARSRTNNVSHKRIPQNTHTRQNGKPNKNNSADRECLPDAPLRRGAQRGLVRGSARGRTVQLGHDLYGRSPDLRRLRLRSHGLCQFLHGAPRTACRKRRKTGRQTGRYTGLDRRRKGECSFIGCPSPPLPPFFFLRACVRCLGQASCIPPLEM